MAIERSGIRQISEISISDHSSAATVAANDDLLTEILLRLPIRSLIRYKSVSTHWLSLISNPSFSFLFNSNNPNPNPNLPSGLLLYLSSRLVCPEFDFVPLSLDEDNAAKPPFRALNFVGDPSGVFILQSCNGLFFCCTNQYSGERRKFYICNPTTKQFTTLPPLGGGACGCLRLIHSLCLAFDPSKSPIYKVVCVWSPDSSDLDPGEQFQIDVYSSQTGLWQVSGKPFTLHPNDEFVKGVYWNGSIHWLSYSEHSLYFNVDQERLAKMSMPTPQEASNKMDFSQYFGESGDHLHLVKPTGSNITVYEMERDYSKWSVKYIVDCNALSMAFPEMIRSCLEPSEFSYYAIGVLSVVRGGAKDEDSFLVLRIPGKALRYNFADKTIKKIYDFNPVEELYGCCISFPFIESLACV